MLVHEFLEGSADRFPEREAVVCRERRLRYREWEQEANRFGRALLSAGLVRHDRVAVFLENSCEAAIGIFGILKAGCVFTVLNPKTQNANLEYILNDCQIRGVLTDARGLRRLSAVSERCPALMLAVVAAASEPLPERTGRAAVRDWVPFLAGETDERPGVRQIDQDLAALIYTSGSTGKPKGVMLTHLNMVSAARSITEYLENRPEDIIYSCLPMAFDYGLYQVLMAAAFGGTVVLERAFTYPFEALERIRQEKVTGFPLVPTLAVLLLELKLPRPLDCPTLRYITNTAQALSPRHSRGLQEAFPQARIFSMYGLTECKRVSYLPPEELAVRPTSVGKAIPNTEVYLVDDQGRVITEAGITGELVVRGSTIMRGYWNLPGETAARLRPGPAAGETVLYTGDYFRRDEQGFLYFIARKDDLIKTAGELVSPREVETALYEHPDVHETLVMGCEDPVLGQAVRALVVRRPGTETTAKMLQAHCARHLESFKVPRIIEFCESLPKTLTGKLAKAGGTADPSACAAYADI